MKANLMKTSSKKNGNGRKLSYRHYARILSKHKPVLEKEYRVSEIGIFGSFIRGEQKQGSDLDILVEFSDVPGLLKFIRMENYLRGILNHKVDLVHKKALRLQLRDSILNEATYL